MSELITPEEFIQSKEFIKALKDIEKGLQGVLGMLDKVSESVKTYHKEVSKGVTTQKELTKNQDLANKSTKETIAIEKETIRLENELIKTKAKIATATSETNKQLIEEKKKLKDVNDQVKGVTDSEKARLKNIGKYKEDIVKAYVAIQGAILFAKTAFNLFVDTMKSTGAGADKFQFTLEGIKQGFNRIKVAVSTLDFKDFIRNVKDAIAEGKRYAEGLDDIDEKTRALRIEEAKQANAILEQRKIQNSALSTTKEKIAAGEKIVAIEERLQNIRTGIGDQAYKNELDNIAKLANAGKDLTDSMREEILLYVTRDESFMKNIEDGKKYAEKLELIAKLDKSYTSDSYKSDSLKAQMSAKLKQLNAELLLMNKENYELLKRVTIPTDEKYNLLKERAVELEQAKGSALENTLRIQSKLDTALSKDEKQTLTSDSKVDNEAIYARQREMYVKGELAMIIESEKEKQDTIDETNRKIEQDAIDLAETNRRLKEQEVKDFEQAEEDKRYAIEETRMLQIDALNAAGNLGQALGNRRIAELESQKERELKAAGDNAKKKEKIEEAYAKKIGVIKRRQAIADKAFSIFNIILDTAKGVMNAMSKVITQPLVPWIVGVGALQASAVIAQPIPKFFKGGTMKKTGLAVVGEEGFELGETKEGKMFLTPDKATVMPLSEGTKITTHEKTIEKLKEIDSSKVDVLIKEQKLTRQAISNQTHSSTHITPEGWRETTRRANSTITHIDKYFRC